MRRAISGLASLVMLGVTAFAMPAAASATTTFVVNRIGDQADLNLANAVCDVSSNSGNQCTLRAAIQEANDTPGGDTINFNITSGSAATKVIAPASALPPITGRVTINGYTQSGASTNTRAVGNNAVLRIVLDGLNAGGLGIGLQIDASNSVIRGLVIQRFGFAGIVIHGTNNAIRGNFIGTDVTGTVDMGNLLGISVRGTDNLIGGTANGARNVISGNNASGVTIRNAASTGNMVQGNYIGTTRSGGTALANTDSGVFIEGAPGTTIGGTASGARNVISGNGERGVACIQTTGILIQGNFIGTDATGTLDLGNGLSGIQLDLSCAGTIGGTIAAARNIVSGNGGDGITASDGNVVQGNFIGTDVTGTAAIGNGLNGVRLSSGNTLGGTVAGARNVISGNVFNGVELFGRTAPSNLVQGNLIGTRADGTGDLGNGAHGVRIQGTGNTVGGTGGAAANIISGNALDGVLISGLSATDNQVQGNVIRSNDRRGVSVEDGPATVTGNHIFQNGDDGVRVSSTAQGTRIIGNHLSANGGLGIDLLGGTESAAGVTANDTLDEDTGANNLQNFPVLTSAVRASNGVTTIQGTLNSTANTEFRIELYIAAPDPSGFGEGQVFQASQNVTTNGAGNAGFIFGSTLPVGTALTATATRVSDGSTSEFSKNITVTP